MTDEHGREPLITTTYGRIGKTTPTRIVDELTRPCRIGTPCPLDRDPDDCEAATHEHASKCLESVSSHAVRRGAITYYLQSDVPLEVVSARANVGPDVLEKQYDRRSERTKME